MYPTTENIFVVVAFLILIGIFVPLQCTIVFSIPFGDESKKDKKK